jgi:hypothetical protein
MEIISSVPRLNPAMVQSVIDRFGTDAAKKRRELTFPPVRRVVHSQRCRAARALTGSSTSGSSRASEPTSRSPLPLTFGAVAFLGQRHTDASNDGTTSIARR